MDVLVRHTPTPPTLRALAMEEAAEAVAAAATAGSVGNDVTSLELEGARDLLRGELTVAIREELVPVVVRHLNSSPAAFRQNKRADPDGDSESWMDCDGVPQIHPTLSSVTYSAIYLLYCPRFRELSICSEFKRDEASRHRVFGILGRAKESALESLHIRCYDETETLQPQLRDSILPFERRLLKKCLANMRHLKHLKMHQVCNDEILLKVGVACAGLQTLDVGGSLEVTSNGIHSVLSGGVQSSLLSADLTRTGSDHTALGYILSRAKRLRCLRADQNLWEELLNCCDSSYPNILSVNICAANHNFLSGVTKCFPNIKSLDADWDGERFNLGTTQRLEHLTTLKVLDANITSLGSISTLTHLTVTGMSSVIDIRCLHEACPNLISLTLVGAKVVQSGRRDNGGGSSSRSHHQSKWDLSLTSLSLRDTLGTAWRDLVRCSPHLAWLSIFNVVISDADVEAIIATNSLSKLEGLRIASDEIGFIRLTEASALLIASKCSSLRSFGSVCDWMVTDLLQLLHTLSSKGGWKMVLFED